MEQENIDEISRKEACERVKQIVKAIKNIKIKYYLNFSKISAKDQELYQNLENNLEKISEDYNLNKLKVSLMAEVDAKYNRKDFENGDQQENPEPDDMLQTCYGVIDAEVNALSKGKIKTAIECQKLLQQYMQRILSPKIQALVLYYKREKFGELIQSREEVDERNEKWIKEMQEFYKKGNTKMRNDAMEAIVVIPKNSVKTIDEILL